MWCVYHFIHLKSGKMYVGKTKSFKTRIRMHLNATKYKKTYFHCALWSFGIDAFSCRIIQEFQRECDALNAEKYWISFWNCCDSKFGYNLTHGGEGVVPSEVTRMKMRVSRRNFLNRQTRDQKRQQYERSSNSLRGKIPWNRPEIPYVKTIKNLKLSQQKLGENNHCAKLTLDQVREIRVLLTQGWFMKELSEKYNVSYSAIKNIKNGHTWSQLK